ncbi:MAG: ABC transporter permease [Phycisphaerales bacterium]
MRPILAGKLLLGAVGVLLWLIADFMYTLSELRTGARPGVYLVWMLFEVLAAVLYGAGVATFVKARLRWSRVIFAPALLLLCAASLAGATLAFERYAPSPSELRAVWLFSWYRVPTADLLWVGCGLAAGSALVVAALGGIWPGGTWGDFRRVVRNWLRSLLISPWRLAFGPIFLKDVRVAGRRVGTYWTRGLYVLALLGLVSLIYFLLRIEQADRGVGGAEMLESLQQIAPALAVAIAWFQYVLLMLLAAALTAPSICDERRTRTLGALMTTPMNSAQIVFGKLFSRLTILFIIALFSVPFLLGARIFGGLEAESVIAMTSITLSSALFMASLGILFSIWSRKGPVAAVMSIFVFVLVEIAPVFILVLTLVRGGGARGGPPMELFVLSSPISLGVITAEITGSAGLPVPVRLLWTTTSVIHVVMSLITLLIASGALRRMMLRDDSPATVARTPRRVRRVVRRATASAGTPDVMDGASAAGATGADSAPPQMEEVFVDRESVVWDQPVLWRELRQPALGSLRNLLVASIVVVLSLVWLYAEIPPWETGSYPVIAAITILITCFAAAVSTTSGVTGEKESSTWLVLLTTPLTPVQILGAKLLGAVRKQWFLAVILLGNTAIGVVAAGMHVIVLFHLAIIMLTVVTLLAGSGLLLSLLVKRPLTATLLNLLFAAAIWVAIPFLGAIIGELAMRRSDDEIGDVVLAINPLYMAVIATGSVADHAERTGALDYRMPSGHLTPFEFTTLLLFVCGVGIAIGLGSLALACRLFVARSGRAS